MSRNWSLAIAVAFVLGYGLKVYQDEQNKLEQEKQQVALQALAEDPVFYGKDDEAVHIFDPSDPRIRVIYFGYTRCPDVCPTSLAMLAGALNAFDEQQLARFRPLFISIDPERDDARQANQYAQYFNSHIEGLSAPLKLTRAVADRYGVIFNKTELKDSAMEYVVDHSSYFYFTQPDGTLINAVPHTLEPTPIVYQMQQLLPDTKPHQAPATGETTDSQQ